MSRAEQLSLAQRLRSAGLPTGVIAGRLRERYGVNARQAVRLACGWTQERAAAEWSARWPDEPKTFKNVSYWENWPGPTGHAPSLVVLDRLAQLYGCDAADLVADWGTHAPPTAMDDAVRAEDETWAWQVEHLSLPELTRSMADWADGSPESRSRLLKLSTAASLAAMSTGSEPLPVQSRPVGDSRALAGLWTSRYRYSSTSRGAEFAGNHDVELVVQDGRLVGRSLPHPTGSSLRLELAIDGTLATGSWTERTSPTGHYRAATFHGVLQLVVDPTGQTMSGRWLGISRRYSIKSGEWVLERAAPLPAR